MRRSSRGDQRKNQIHEDRKSGHQYGTRPIKEKRKVRSVRNAFGASPAGNDPRETTEDADHHRFK